ncbi:bacteriohemerythrin [bacterium 3DAC]|nr:bacteriohemerythrin [bacterium 3DAC]
MVKKIEWSDEFMLGIPEIDMQHRSLVNSLNKLVEKYDTNPGEIKEILDFLVDYVLLHFETEETLMDKYAYPDMDEHVKEHRAFTKDLNKLMDDFIMLGPSPEMERRIEKGLVSWIENHIMNVDKKMGKYLKEKMGS